MLRSQSICRYCYNILIFHTIRRWLRHAAVPSGFHRKITTVNNSGRQSRHYQASSQRNYFLDASFSSRKARNPHAARLPVAGRSLKVDAITTSDIHRLMIFTTSRLPSNAHHRRPSRAETRRPPRVQRPGGRHVSGLGVLGVHR